MPTVLTHTKHGLTTATSEREQTSWRRWCPQCRVQKVLRVLKVSKVLPALTQRCPVQKVHKVLLVLLVPRVLPVPTVRIQQSPARKVQKAHRVLKVSKASKASKVKPVLKVPLALTALVSLLAERPDRFLPKRRTPTAMRTGSIQPQAAAVLPALTVTLPTTSGLPKVTLERKPTSWRHSLVPMELLALPVRLVQKVLKVPKESKDLRASMVPTELPARKAIPAIPAHRVRRDSRARQAQMARTAQRYSVVWARPARPTA